MTPFFVMLRDTDNEPDDLQQQENIYLVEFSAEYEDADSQREPTAAWTLIFGRPLRLNTVGGLHCRQTELPCREQLSQ